MPEGWFMAGCTVFKVYFYCAVFSVAGAALSVVVYRGVKEVEYGFMAAAAEFIGYEGDVFVGYVGSYVY